MFYTSPRTEIRGTEFDAATGRESFPQGSEVIWNESQAWIHVGRFLWWQPEIEQLASDALHILLDVPAGRPLPPLITVHVRCALAPPTRGLTPQPHRLWWTSARALRSGR